jgi:hypothetical protein
MVNVHWPDGVPTVALVAARYDVPVEAFDDAFGVIAVSPDDRVFTVRVLAEWAATISGESSAEGPFPDGRISAFGPPEE